LHRDLIGIGLSLERSAEISDRRFREQSFALGAGSKEELESILTASELSGIRNYGRRYLQQLCHDL
jgi:hypothetical protein